MSGQPVIRRSKRLTRREVCLASLAGLTAPLAAACSVGTSGESRPETVLGAASLDVWLQFGNAETDRVLAEKIIPAFKVRQPNVEVRGTPGSTLPKLLTAAAAGTPPHLVQMGAATVVSAVQAGIALPLNAHTKSWSSMTDFVPAALEQARWKGELLGLPYDAQPNTYWWRQDLLQQLGIAKVPETYEESVEAARRLTVVDGQQVTRSGLRAINPWAEFFKGMRSLGLPLAKQGKATFNGPEGVMLVQYMVDRHTASVPPGTTAPAPGNNPLGQGLWGAGYGSYQNLINNVRTGAPDVYANLTVGKPLAAGGQRYAALAGKKAQPVALTFHNWWMIGKAAGANDQAWAFLQHLLTPEWLLAFDDTIGTMTPRKSLLGQGFQAEEKIKKIGELYAQQASYQYKYPDPARSNGAVNMPLIRAMDRAVSPKAALDEAAQAWDAIMAEVGFTDDAV